MRNLPRNIITAIDRFDEATQRFSVKGSLRPEDAHAAEHQHQQAREKLEMIIQKALEKR